MDSLNNAIAQMRAAGMPEFPPGHPQVGLGRITRYGPKKTAWYVLHEFRTRSGQFVVGGAYGCWGKIESTKIEIDWAGISADERAEVQRAQRAAEEREQAKRLERSGNAANRAAQQWKAAGLVPSDNPYVARKQVVPEGARAYTDGTLLIPVYRWDDDLDAARIAGLQQIQPDGTKRFTKNMRMDGGYCRLGPVPQEEQTLILCEGWATGCSIRMATQRKHPVFVAFNAGNLVPVAMLLRARYPSSCIVIAADDDWKTTRPDNTPWNPGTDYASRAAIACGLEHARVVVPVFPDASTRDDKWTDFNDLHLQVSLDAAAEQLNESLSPDNFDPMGSARKPSVGYEGHDDGDVAAFEAALASIPDAENGLQTPVLPNGKNEDDPIWAWKKDLKKTDKGATKPVMHNLMLILKNHRDLVGMLGFDQYSELIMKVSPPPWHDYKVKFRVSEWTELDDYRLRHWLSTRYFEAKEKDVMQAVTLVAREKQFHPLIEKIEATPWDGEHRLRMWPITYLGACQGKDFEKLSVDERDRIAAYTERAGVMWMVGAIARVYVAADPATPVGAQVDTMLILEGEQGIMKSSALRVLGGEWFTDERLDFNNKDSLMVLQGRWIVEMAELEGMNKAESSSIKQFIPKRQDLFRLPYGRMLVKKPRRCIFAGTVNHDAYLKDDSGNRRFLPIVCTKIDIEALKRDVDQLWAEALHMYRHKVTWWIEEKDRRLFAEEQEKRYQEDAWQEPIEGFIGSRTTTSTAEVMAEALKIDSARWDKMSQMRVGAILRRMGFKRVKIGDKNSRCWGYRREVDPSIQGPVVKGEQDDAPF
ncbi:MAG: VapE domain-containing protein [Rhodospirillales bacterium]